MEIYGIEALIRIITHLIFIYLSFISLQSLRLDQIFKKNKTYQIQLFYILFSIVLGYISSSFLLEIMILFKNFVFGLSV